MNKLTATYAKLSSSVTITKGLAGPQKGEYRLVVKGRNGERLMTSEGYVDHRDAPAAIGIIIGQLASTEMGRNRIIIEAFKLMTKGANAKQPTLKLTM